MSLKAPHSQAELSPSYCPLMPLEVWAFKVLRVNDSS